MNKFTKLAVIGFTAFAFTACDSNSSGSVSEEVALTALESGGYVVNVSSELLSEDDNFDIYLCNDGEEGTYYILNETGDDIAHEGSTYVYEDENNETMNIWSDWPSAPETDDVEIITAGTVHPGYLVEGETYDLEEYDEDVVVGSMTVNVIEMFDCATLPGFEEPIGDF